MRLLTVLCLIAVLLAVKPELRAGPVPADPIEVYRFKAVFGYLLQESATDPVLSRMGRLMSFLWTYPRRDSTALVKSINLSGLSEVVEFYYSGRFEKLFNIAHKDPQKSRDFENQLIKAAKEAFMDSAVARREIEVWIKLGLRKPDFESCRERGFGAFEDPEWTAADLDLIVSLGNLCRRAASSDLVIDSFVTEAVRVLKQVEGSSGWPKKC